jgi:hypothetical protein
MAFLIPDYNLDGVGTIAAQAALDKCELENGGEQGRAINGGL